MKNLLKRLRAWVPFNVFVGRILRTLLGLSRRLEDVRVDWRLAGTRDVEFHGARFTMTGRSDDRFFDEVYYGSAYEEAETLVFATLAPHAQTIIDIGANTGGYALMTAQLAPTARVVAVEPVPANADRIRENLRLNNLDRVTLVQAAVGSSDGEIEMTVPAGRLVSDVASVHAGFSKAHMNEPDETIRVPLKTIDTIVAELGLDRVDLIKLDVEYHELEALRGAVRTLERDAPVVMCEVLNYEVLVKLRPGVRGAIDPDNAAGVEAFMRDAGYTAFAIGKHGALRVESLRGVPQGLTNYLFVKNPPADPFYVLDDPALAALVKR